MKKKNILVLGGAGFIGALLCERLLQNDNNVICVDNFISSGEKNINHLLKLPNFKFINKDVSKGLDLDKIKDLDIFQVKVFGISEIYNLACPTSIKNFEKLREDTVRANTVGLINALDIAVKYKAKFLQFSTSVIYGDTPRGKFITEDFQGLLDLKDERACYDAGKFYAEAVVNTYQKVHNLDTKIIRIFRTYGPKMLLDDGQMIPDFIVNALENKDLVIIGKKQFQTSLCYVSDIVEGAMAVMKSDLNKAVNLGSPEIFKIVDVAKEIIRLTNSKSKIVFNGEELFMRELAVPDINLVKEEIGWLPIISLEDGLKKTIDFTRANKDLLTFSKDI
ncbi:NAD-dependent epimerase/dehydratase family protein [Candidatus Falkowbacteria bacterium]|jgi:UDP-glucuronate decarboxylase|nr:NAD-dependent epimerase/dehydratase family protein [Candidatus Falkowbacteria bacterium]